MTPTTPLPHADPWSPSPARPAEVIVVHNPGDDAAAARHLAELSRAGLSTGCVVVRPTPGASDARTLGLDVLIATGKNPRADQTERLTGTPWELAHAWLSGCAITDLLIDRAHRLTGEQAAAIGHLAAVCEARVWLIWGTATHPGPLLQTMGGRAPAPAAEHIILAEFLTRMPAPPEDDEPAQPAVPAGEPIRGPLPEADFTTFLAEARRLLPAGEFARVEQVYYAAAEYADAWIQGHQHLDAGGERIPVRLAGAVAGWLRDEMLGPLISPEAALVTLRAVQAALFIDGYLLSWNSEALGPAPAARLTGDLTADAARALMGLARTDIAAATALSLHLNHGPRHFDLIHCGQVAPDGSEIHLHAEAAGVVAEGAWNYFNGPPYTQRRLAHPWARQRTTTEQFWEMTTPEPILIPAPARPLIAAHLAWRIGQGARGDSVFFVHPHEPGVRPPEQILREGISRTCRRYGIYAPWVHTGDCKDGADIGYVRRGSAWMGRRGLRLRRLPLGTRPGHQERA